MLLLTIYSQIYNICSSIDEFFAFPSLCMFLGIGIFLTFKTRFVQVRAFPRFIHLLSHGIKHEHTGNEKSINPFHALLTSMATTIGMGNIVGPTIAISTGGPGALFWLIAYAFFGAVTKFTEVSFAINFRTRLASGNLIGGPTQYLKQVSTLLATWYGILTVFLFAGWSGLQANTLATIFSLEAIPKTVTGLILASIVLIVVRGGIVRIGEVTSKLVPLMFVMYVTFTLSIILSDLPALWSTICLVVASAFSPSAAVGGFLGATVVAAMRQGINRSIYITEAGLGTSCIAHSMADTEHASDQAILAMYSIIADTFLATLSGLLILVTGLWSNGAFSNTLVYEAFKQYSPGFGKWVLLLSVMLFVVTTVIGNSFNASQSFASFTKYRWMNWYYLFLAVVVILGAHAQVPLVWKIMDVMQIMVAIPHIIGLFILTCKRSDVLNI
jgi:AGCS family alanine or glycine:cation symporter